MGFVDKLDFQGNGLPDEPEFQAKVFCDFSKPTPGCFVPLRMVKSLGCTLEFRYEGVFKFCKKCGLLGHYISNCRTTNYGSYTRITSCLDRLEKAGFKPIVGPSNFPLYSN